MKVTITIEDRGDMVVVESDGLEDATPEELQTSCAAQLYAIVATVIRRELKANETKPAAAAQEKEISEYV